MKKEMKKLLRSKKALSPVIASIILIAVTVAVSIAVAAWMGALTLGMTGNAEQLAVGLPWGWTLPSPGTVYINVTNNGGSSIILSAVRIGGSTGTITVNWSSDAATTGMTLGPGERAGLLITYTGHAFSAGVPYTITIVTQANHEFPTTGTAPG
jgi:flagellin-like protein